MLGRRNIHSRSPRTHIIKQPDGRDLLHFRLPRHDLPQPQVVTRGGNIVLFLSDGLGGPKDFCRRVRVIEGAAEDELPLFLVQLNDLQQQTAFIAVSILPWQVSWFYLSK